jgi:hypothetical protein
MIASQEKEGEEQRKKYLIQLATEVKSTTTICFVYIQSVSIVNYSILLLEEYCRKTFL